MGAVMRCPEPREQGPTARLYGCPPCWRLQPSACTGATTWVSPLLPGARAAAAQLRAPAPASQSLYWDRTAAQRPPRQSCLGSQSPTSCCTANSEVGSGT